MDERTQVLAAHPQASGGWRRAAAGTRLRTVVALVSVAVLGTMGYGWWAVGDVDEGTVTTDVIAQDVEDQRVPLDGAVDMLLVGIDSRTDALRATRCPARCSTCSTPATSDGERNTDTMILVHIPVDGTRAIAISFPRDSWVELAGGFGKHRLNSAFAYAYNDAREELAQQGRQTRSSSTRRPRSTGRKNLIATVQNLIGKAGHDRPLRRGQPGELLRGHQGHRRRRRVPERGHRGPEVRRGLPAGAQTIAGRKALAFVRQRHGLPNGDLDRIVRQQAFLGALANKVLSADMLTSPAKVRAAGRAPCRSRWC